MKFFMQTKWLLGLVIISAPLLAENNELEKHVPVGSRASGHAERIHIREAKYDLIKKIEDGDVLTEEEMYVFDEENIDQKAFNSELIEKKGMDTEAYYTTHDGAMHNPVYVSILGDTVELEDGSIWLVASDDRHKTLDWMTGDVTIILPNHKWFSSYDFRLVNLNTGANVKVNLSLGPIYNGIYTHWIIAIDYEKREIYLEDGSVWKMSRWDASTVNDWLPNDTVLMGINDGWFSGGNPNMLINVNMDDHAIGTCVY